MRQKDGEGRRASESALVNAWSRSATSTAELLGRRILCLFAVRRSESASCSGRTERKSDRRTLTAC